MHPKLTAKLSSCLPCDLPRRSPEAKPGVLCGSSLYVFLCLFAAHIFFVPWCLCGPQKNQSNAQAPVERFEYFQKFSNVSHHFSNIFKRFAPFFERFQTFSNVFTLPVLPNRYILTHQPPFLPQKPTSPLEKHSQKSPFFQIPDNFSPKFDSFV